MSGVDVRDLQRESLPQDAFPAASRADFRFYMAPEVRRGIGQHAKKDDSVEICGVLVGRWGEDADGPFAAATNYVPCENAASKFAEVTFTHESWAQINKEMDTRFADLRIVGWYHSHPDFGIFLSDRDCFIQEHFFSGPGQVAYVIDPVRDLEGVFAWRNGKPQRLPHFWIGDAIRAAEPAGHQPSGPAMPTARPLPATNAAASAGPIDQSWLGALTQVLAWLAIFLLGFLYSNWWLSRQQENVIRGAAARIAMLAELDVLKTGMEKDLVAVHDRLAAIGEELKKVPAASEALKPDEVKAAAKQRRLIASNLNQCRLEIAQIAQEYGLSPEEQAAIALAMAEKEAGLRAALEDAHRKGAESAAKKPAGKPPSPPQENSPAEGKPKD